MFKAKLSSKTRSILGLVAAALIAVPVCTWGQASQGSDMPGMSGMSASTTGRACDDTSHMGAMTVVMEDGSTQTFTGLTNTAGAIYPWRVRCITAITACTGIIALFR